jgi:hypothetical protein
MSSTTALPLEEREGDDDDDDFEEDDVEEGETGFFAVPSSVLDSLKAAAIVDSELPIALEAEKVPEDQMLVKADPSNFLEMVNLSDIKALRESGRFFVDAKVPKDFAITLENSVFPLCTNRELFDSKSMHHGSAKNIILQGVATWEIVARQIKVFEESEGRTPPALEFTIAEKLTGITGGVYQ